MSNQLFSDTTIMLVLKLPYIFVISLFAAFAILSIFLVLGDDFKTAAFKTLIITVIIYIILVILAILGII
jgi:hypothetical protein